jgi:hypothetical protein
MVMVLLIKQQATYGYTPTEHGLTLDKLRVQQEPQDKQVVPELPEYKALQVLPEHQAFRVVQVLQVFMEAQEQLVLLGQLVQPA